VDEDERMPPCLDPRDLSRDIVRVGGRNWSQDHQHAIDLGLVEHGGERIGEELRCRAGAEVDRVAHADVRSHELAQRLLRGGTELGHLERSGGARVGGENGCAAGVADDGETATRHRRLVRSSPPRR
jgi:hypothetical protein